MRSKKCFQADPSVFFNPTKLLGFICPIKNIGLILGRPSFPGFQKKKFYQIYMVNLFPGNEFFKIDLIKIFWLSFSRVKNNDKKK